MKELTLGYLVKGDSVLLAMKKRGFGKGKWNGVGGKLEPGESMQQAMIRECQEEISVTPTMFYQTADLTFDEFHDGVPAQHHVQVFIITEWEGTPAESEEMKPQWFSKDSLPYEQMWSDDQFWLAEVLRGDKIIGHFKLDENDNLLTKEIQQVTTF